MGVQPREAARARSKVADGRLRLALTTERAHFFLRICTRGVKARVSLTRSGCQALACLISRCACSGCDSSIHCARGAKTYPNLL